MDNWTFGWTLIVVGMGGTITVLGLLALLMGLLKRLFPAEAATAHGKKPSSSK